MGQPRLLTFYELCILLGMCTAAFPETLLGLESSIMLRYVYLLFGLAMIGSLCSRLSGRDGRLFLSPQMFITGLAGAYMLVLGIVYQVELKFLLVDMVIFGSLVLGIQWGESHHDGSAWRAAVQWNSVLVVMLLVNMIGLAKGFILPSEEDSRIFNYGLFACTGTISILFPVVYCGTDFIANGKNVKMGKALAVLGIIACVGAAFLTGTRSVLVVAIISIAVTMWLRLSLGKSLLWGTAGLLVWMGCKVNADSRSPIAESVLIERFISADIESSYRYQEVYSLFEQLEGHLFTGLGLGNRFWGIADLESEILVLAPHIGILTLLQKGGLVLFSVLIVLPLVRVITNLLRKRGYGECRKRREFVPPAVWSACCVVFMTQACISGGWKCQSLFLFGAMLACATRSAEVRQQKPVNKRPVISVSRTSLEQLSNCRAG